MRNTRELFFVCVKKYYKLQRGKKKDSSCIYPINIQGLKSCRKEGSIKCIQLIDSLKLPILLNFHVRS